MLLFNNHFQCFFFFSFFGIFFSKYFSALIISLYFYFYFLICQRIFFYFTLFFLLQYYFSPFFYFDCVYFFVSFHFLFFFPQKLTYFTMIMMGHHTLWTSGQVQHRKSAIHGLPVTLRMFRVKFDKSDWFWSQSIVFTKPFKNGMSLD